MIEFKEVFKRYPAHPNLFENFSLTLGAGEWLNLVGPPGSGKSTLLRMMAGLEKPSSGTLTFNGQNLYRLRATARSRLRQRMGLIFPDPTFLEEHSLLDNVALPLDIQGLPRKERSTRAQNALQRVGLGNQSSLMARQLSQNARQRLMVARAISGYPVLLLVDDFYHGWPQEQRQLLENLLGSFHQGGVTVVIAGLPGGNLLSPKARTLTLSVPAPHRIGDDT